MTLLLDTCVFVWLCAEPARLSERVRTLLSEKGALLFLSDISVLEMTLKWQAGKLELPAPPRTWVEEQTSIWGTTPLSLTRSSIYRSSELPLIHRDPFDRLLVATALENEIPIVTPDPVLPRYPVACIWR